MKYPWPPQPHLSHSRCEWGCGNVKKKCLQLYPRGQGPRGSIKPALRNLFIIVDGMTLMAASQDSELAQGHPFTVFLFKRALRRCLTGWILSGALVCCSAGYARWLSKRNALSLWVCRETLKTFVFVCIIHHKNRKVFSSRLCFWDPLFMKII